MSQENVEVVRRVYSLLAERGAWRRGAYDQVIIDYRGIEGVHEWQRLMNEIEIRVAHVSTLEDGRVMRTEVFLDRHEALEAVGASEWQHRDTGRAMSQENVEIVREMWGAFLGDDPTSGLSFCHPDIEWDGTNLPDGQVARGHEAIVEHLMRWAEMWDEWRMEPERLIDVGGDQVILVFREIGRSESGLKVDERHAELYAVRQGKVVYRKGFSDPADALEAVGLSE